MRANRKLYRRIKNPRDVVENCDNAIFAHKGKPFLFVDMCFFRGYEQSTVIECTADEMLEIKQWRFAK